MSASSFHLPGAPHAPNKPPPDSHEVKLLTKLGLTRDCLQRASGQLDVADPRYTDWWYVLHQLIRTQEQLSGAVVIALEKCRGTGEGIGAAPTLAETDHRLDALPNTDGTQTNGGDA